MKSGIPGLDEMIEGGFRRNSTTLVSGGCGSGKSTFCMQFVYSGAAAGEPGVYITFEEFPENMKESMLRYGWNIDEMEKKKQMKILRLDPMEVVHVIKEDYGPIVNAVSELKAKRVVIDSMSSIEAMIENDFEKRRNVLELTRWLKDNNCTSLLIGESEQDPNVYSRQGVIEFAVDGVIVLYNIRRESARHRALEVLKMRGTNHMNKIVPFVIKDGIELMPKQKLFGV
ncbi:MAG: ATPase domain-containing protein [Candidatus Altiarchaeota archaeon]